MSYERKTKYRTKYRIIPETTVSRVRPMLGDNAYSWEDFWVALWGAFRECERFTGMGSSSIIWGLLFFAV